MIRVNFKELQWREGLTVEKLLETVREEPSYRVLLRDKATVVVNNEVIPPSEYKTTFIKDGDEIRIYPVIAGG